MLDESVSRIARSVSLMVYARMLPDGLVSVGVILVPGMNPRFMNLCFISGVQFMFFIVLVWCSGSLSNVIYYHSY